MWSFLHYSKCVMKVLGIDIISWKIYFALLEWTNKIPKLLKKWRYEISFDKNKIPELMDFFDSTFKEMIHKHSPDIVSYKLKLDPTKDQMFYSIFPMWILNLIAHSKGISIMDFNYKNIVPKKFWGNVVPLSENKKKLENICDSVFWKQPPYWREQRYSILVARLAL